VLADDNEQAIRLGREALAMADDFGLEELRAHALNNIGLARFHSGDADGVADLERSVEVAVAAKSPEAARAYNNLGALVWQLGDARRGGEFFRQATRVGEELGSAIVGRYARIVLIQFSFAEGDWDEAFRQADEFISACETGEAHYLESSIRSDRAKARLARGEVEGALDDVAKAIDHARRSKDPQTLEPSLSRGARLHAEVGRLVEARRLTDELLGVGVLAYPLVDVAFIANDVDRVDPVRRAIDRVQYGSRFRDAARSLVDGEFEQAADILVEIGNLDDEAAARLRAAEKLLREGRRAEADVQLQKALAFFRTVGATRYIREAESLLAASA
jgi:tetratricopeptide (TPR) repeat protein